MTNPKLGCENIAARSAHPNIVRGLSLEQVALEEKPGLVLPQKRCAGTGFSRELQIDERLDILLFPDGAPKRSWSDLTR
jgi:hypothetical protein